MSVDSVDHEFLAEARERTPHYAREFAGKIGVGEERLARAGCPKACPVCVYECAIRWIAFATWERFWLEEEAKLVSEAKGATVQ